MDGKWTARLFACVMALATWSAAAAWAATPWERMLTLSRVEADPNKSYELTDAQGPWLIMACSFTGEGAQKQAHNLALELRDRYKLPAYVHKMTFELGEAFGRGCDQFGSPMKMKYRRGSSEVREIAVLVGDFPAVDDPEAQRVLRSIKYMHPSTLDVDPNKHDPQGKTPDTYQSLAGWRKLQQMVMDASQENKKKGPMGQAFVTTNPLLPREYFAPKGLDEFVVRLNDGLDHSLLRCPGKYSVQVAHFSGETVLDQAEIEAIKHGSKSMKSRLAEAGETAHRLTEILRKKGYEAYEFHDRGASIVTVGSFDSLGTPRADGKTELDPKIVTIMQVFGSAKENLAGNNQGFVKAKVEEGIPFDVTPLPVPVPKRSVAADYHRGAMSQR